MKKSGFPVLPVQSRQLRSSKLSPGQIGEQKQRVFRGFEGLQEELERLQHSMSAEEWERFNQPL